MNTAGATFWSILLLLAWQAAPAQKVRVLLAEVASADMVMPSGHRGYIDGTFGFMTSHGLTWPLRARSGQLWIDDQPIGVSFALEPSEGLVAWQERLYRGTLEFRALDDKLLVINVVDVEDYLRGVVPAEMHAVWPLEALKAQAVAARSYALASLKPDEPYDICAGIQCQVYHGVLAEHPNSDLAVRETRGLVVTYEGSVARTHYHAHSGGYLASSAEVWGLDAPYLSAREDVNSPSPHTTWEMPLDPVVIAASLAELELHLGTVRSLQVLAYSDSGRVQRARVIGDGGHVTLEGTLLTSLLRSWGLKSTRFLMRADLVASGEGYGHGVGMSQYGAYSLAASDYTFEEILDFYYPGTQLLPLQELGAGP